MKFLPVLIVCSTTAMAAAQEPTDPLEQQIWQAYGNLQNDSTYQFVLTGTETVNGTTRGFTSYLYWNYSSLSGALPQVELDDYDTTTSTPALLRRYVGDGRTLWFYDLQNRRFMASPYSYYGASAPSSAPPQPDGYAAVLLAQLYAQAKGPSAYLVRLMREINPGSNALSYPSRYESWAPGYKTSTPPTTPPTYDPLVPPTSPLWSPSWVYADAGATEWVNYGLSNPSPNRSVAFELLNTDTSGGTNYVLQQINFANQEPNRFTEWILTVTDPAIPGPGIFVPYPAAITAGWQQISSQKLG